MGMLFRTRATAGLGVSVGDVGKCPLRTCLHHATADSPPRQSWKHSPNTALRAPSYPTQRATPELLSVWCGKCIPYTQKAFVRRRCSRVLQVECYCWFQLRSFPCPIHVSFDSHGSSGIPWLPKISCAWNSFRSAVSVLIGPGACCKRCTAPMIVWTNS